MRRSGFSAVEVVRHFKPVRLRLTARLFFGLDNILRYKGGIHKNILHRPDKLTAPDVTDARMPAKGQGKAHDARIGAFQPTCGYTIIKVARIKKHNSFARNITGLCQPTLPVLPKIDVLAILFWPSQPMGRGQRGEIRNMSVVFNALANKSAPNPPIENPSAFDPSKPAAVLRKAEIKSSSSGFKYQSLDAL